MLAAATLRHRPHVETASFCSNLARLGSTTACDWIQGKMTI
jgi:hypothetical protein